MQNKKGQSEVITTVLIILLVLAAIVIVWQVVNSTVSNAAGEAKSQASCLGFSVTLGEITPGTNKIISGYPNKKVDNVKVYVNGVNVWTSSTTLIYNAGDSFSTSAISTLNKDDVITVTSNLSGTQCDGKVSKKV